jgi:hypothetical protein
MSEISSIIDEIKTEHGKIFFKFPEGSNVLKYLTEFEKLIAKEKKEKALIVLEKILKNVEDMAASNKGSRFAVKKFLDDPKNQTNSDQYIKFTISLDGMNNNVIIFESIQNKIHLLQNRIGG